MLYSKSQAAFTLSALKLFDEHPSVYFWTFTFTRVHHDWCYPVAWNMFMKHIQNWHGQFMPGLRVLELHREHGIHYHALIAIRMSVHIVRRVGKRYGIGRIHVQKANRGSILYLAKYVTPRNNDGLTKGMRRWGAMGGFRPVTSRRIEVDSMFHRNMKEITNGKRCSYLMARDIYSKTQLHGRRADWEKPKQSAKRDFYLTPHTKYQLRRKPDVGPESGDVYDMAVLWPKKSVLAR